MASRTVYLANLALIWAGVSAPAQQAPVFGEADKAAIESMYDGYVQAFVKKDYVALREYVQVPFVVAAGGEMQTLLSVDSVIERYRKMLTELERRNYHHSVMTGSRIIALTPDTAIVNKSYRRFKKDGSVLEKGAAVYPACKSAAGWKLCGLMRQDPRYFGKVY